jgi:Nuclease-related domain.
MTIQHSKKLPVTSTKGERKVVGRLSKLLDESYSLYFEPMIGKLTPDVLIVGPNLGLLILEVKDYKISNLYQVERDNWKFTDGTVSRSPYKQARGLFY